MNKVCLVGRLTSTPELKYNSNNDCYTRFNLAVNRKYTNANGEREADFISCVAFRKTAETIAQYLIKGLLVGIEGNIRTGSYTDKDGNNRYTTDVYVENIIFLESRKSESQNKNNDTEKEQDPFTEDPYADYGESISIDDNFLD